jgi:hypothetical protein
MDDLDFADDGDEWDQANQGIIETFEDDNVNIKYIV